MTCGCEEKYRPLVVLFFLSLLAFLIYSNTFSASFHFDDAQNIVDNPKIKDLANFLDLSGGRYVGFLTFALNYRLGGLHVFGYRLVNLLIHIANGSLVYSLILLLFRASRSQEDRASWIAFVAALLFITHPIQTQAITYVIQRFASLATLFYLLGVVGYLKWRLGGRFFWYVGGGLSAVLAMKTKENSFTLPFMILLVEWVFFTRKRWVVVIPFLLTLSIIPLSYPGAIGEGEAGFFRDTMEISRSEYLFTQFRVLMTYLRLLILPVHQNLDYDYPVYRSLFAPPVFLSFLFLSSLFALAIYLLRRVTRRPSPLNPQFKLIAFGILWFFLTLSIESSIIPIRDVIFEHRVYLPSVGLFLVMGIGIMTAEKRFRTGEAWSFRKPDVASTWVVIFIGVIAAFLSVAAYKRNTVWRDQVSLWQDVVAKSPRKARSRNNLAVAYKNKGMLEAAIRESQTALDLKPDYVEAHGNLGDSYAEQGRSEDAINQYQLAVKLQPDNVKAYNNLGIVYKKLGRLDDAVTVCQVALKLQPDYAPAHNNLGSVYAAQGRLDDAIQEYHQALKFDPGLGDARYNLGNAYALQEHWEAAIHEYQIALNLQPGDPDVHYNLGLTYMFKGNREAAKKEFEQALKIKSETSLK